MRIPARLTFSVLGFALAIPMGIAAAQNFKAPQQPEFKALSALMAIKSPASNACPAQAKMVGWIKTNRPGTVLYMVARKGGAVSGPFKATAVEAASGAMATISRDMQIHQPIDAEYRILVADGT